MNYPRIVLATKNLHKLAELETMLGVPCNLLVAINEYPEAPDVEENGTSFGENALIKARALRDFTGEWTIADDSGLEVDILDGAPGIYSARYAGLHGDDKANNEKLLIEIEKAIKNKANSYADPNETRKGRYVCAMALASPDGQEFLEVGSYSGIILHEPRGKNGFGYDPLFLPSGYNKTFAEISSEEKCQFSHRAIAAKKMRITFENLFL